MKQNETLSRREEEVISQLLKGKSNKQIAYSLGISERTVEFHLNNIYEKMGVNSRVELILQLGESTGRNFENQVDSTVDMNGYTIHNDKRSGFHIFWEHLSRTGKSGTKEVFVMNPKLVTILAPIVILLGGVLIAGGIITQKYGAVVGGIIIAGVAAQQWIGSNRKKEKK